MYLNQVRKHRLLGLVGYVVFAVGYLGIMCVTFAAAYVLPEVATSNPGFVNDAIVVNTSRGTMHGDIGAFATAIKVGGFAYLVGSLLFGIALYRARVCPAGPQPCSRSPASPPPPLADARRLYRLLAFPNGIAMIALGYSLWKVARTETDTETQQKAVEVPQRSTAGVE